MSGYLLDTNVISEIRKPNCDTAVAAWAASVPGDDLFLSALVVGEIRRGANLLRIRDPKRAASYDRWLAEIRRSFIDRILPIDEEIAEEWGRIGAAVTLPAVEGLISATAKVRGMVMVTRNLRDFAPAGVQCLNPFEFEKSW